MLIKILRGSPTMMIGWKQVLNMLITNISKHRTFCPSLSRGAISLLCPRRWGRRVTRSCWAWWRSMPTTRSTGTTTYSSASRNSNQSHQENLWNRSAGRRNLNVKNRVFIMIISISWLYYFLKFEPLVSTERWQPKTKHVFFNKYQKYFK